jgi:hypothetical protein
MTGYRAASNHELPRSITGGRDSQGGLERGRTICAAGAALGPAHPRRAAARDDRVTSSRDHEVDLGLEERGRTEGRLRTRRAARAGADAGGDAARAEPRRHSSASTDAPRRSGERLAEAEFPDALATHLFARGITPTDIKPVAKSQDAARPVAPPRRRSADYHRLDPVLAADVLITKAGCRCCAASASRSRPECRAAEVLTRDRGLRPDVTFRSRRAFPEVFSKFYVSVIRVGESPGTLESAFCGCAIPAWRSVSATR